jgi:hypothetical protein
LRAELLVQRPAPQSPSYAFRHALMRDVAYGTLPRSARRKLHGQIAAALQQLGLDDGQAHLAELAWHHAEAEDFDAAVDCGTRAAALSLERFALAEALAQARSTAAWLLQLGEVVRAPRELRLNGLLSQTLMAMRGWGDSEVRATMDQTEALVARVDASRHQERVLAALYHGFLYHHVASNRAQCRELAGRFRALAGDDTGNRAAGATLLGLALHADGDFRGAAQALEEALALYQPEAHQHHGSLFGLDTFVWACATLGLVRWFSHGPEDALACADRALARARLLAHVPSVAMALLYQAILHQYSRDRAGARRATEELLGLAAKYGLPAYEGYAAVIHGWACGNSETARAILGALPQMGCRLALHYYGALAADTDAEQGNFPGALAQLEQCLAWCQEHEDRALEPELHRWRAHYLYASAQQAAAELGSSRSTAAGQLAEACRALETAVLLARQRGLLRTESLALESLRAWRENVAAESHP